MNGKPVLEIPAKSVINLDSGFKPKLLCDGPTFTMGDACAYTCSFCYVPSVMNQRLVMLKREGAIAQETKHLDVVIRRKFALELMRQQLTDKKGNPKYLSADDRRVIYASPLVDVAANMELVRETVEACLMILELTNWQIRLLSKSNLLPKVATMLCERVTMDLKVKSRMIFGVSTGTLNDGLAAAFEGGTARVSKRIESLHWLQDNGFRTYGMICPSLPHDDYQQFADEMYAAIRAEKCEHVWAEVINVRGESFDLTHKALLAAGYTAEAEWLSVVANSTVEWEAYNRRTFEAHADLYRPGRLRYLVYAKKADLPYWQSKVPQGAVLL